MAETEKIISLDLNDPRMKHLSEVFGNESCKKILNILAEKELTETEIAKELKMPLNSVDYNIKKLLQVGLIESESHWWSIRGKKMPSYRIANKKIIISPKRTGMNFFIPLVATVAIFFIGVRKYSILNKWPIGNFSKVSPIESAKTMAIQGSLETSVFSSVDKIAYFGIVDWWELVLLGVWLGILVFFLLNYFIEKRK